MLEVKCENEADYRLRWPLARNCFFTKPDLKLGKPLEITDRKGLTELSFLFFVGWLFTSILNQSKLRYSLALLPVGAGAESSVLVLFRRHTHLAAPSRRMEEFIEPDYFTCPRDLIVGRELTEAEKHLCPVINKLRYNLSQVRPNDIAGLIQPQDTGPCCASKKAALWEFLKATLMADPDLYGPVVGGTAFPIHLPYKFLQDYLTGTSPKTDDLGKLLEETILWFAMAASKVLIGSPHSNIVSGPGTTYEMDMLLYESPVGRHIRQKNEPTGGWTNYLADQAVCLIELTVGHHPDLSKKDGEDEDAPGRTGYIGAGNDKPVNKLVNFQALLSWGFRLVQSHYITVTSSQMSAVTKRALTMTPGFKYACLADVIGENIHKLVLDHEDVPVSNATARRWHGALVKLIEDAAQQFRATIDAE